MADGTVLVPNGTGGTLAKLTQRGPFGDQDGYTYTGSAQVTSRHNVGATLINKASGGNIWRHCGGVDGHSHLRPLP